MSLFKTLNKQGGIKLLKQYWYGGAFFTAVGELFLLGKSRIALEILRLSATLKMRQKMEKKYCNILEQFDEDYDESLPHEMSNKVWVCWFQGIENAPDIVRKCYSSIKDNMIDKEIILVSEDNMMQYVRFPEYILKKWKNGIISHAQMADLLRLELLINYGGMWIDATVFCSSNNIPDYFFDSDLFFFQCLKPGRDGHSHYLSSWLISAKSNNKILMAVRDLCHAYWRDNDSVWDYFLIHDFMSIVLERYQDDWKKIIPRDNATPHLLLLRLFEQFDERTWNAIKSQTPFHKMTYKFQEEQIRIAGTYYDELFK